MPPIRMIAIANTGTFQNQERPHDCAIFGENDRAADHDGEAQILDRQKNQIRVIVDLTQSHDLAVQCGVLKCRTLFHARNHRAWTSSPNLIEQSSGRLDATEYPSFPNLRIRL